ncbi:hypothetical protein F2P79_000937 [Pimephales promelas]|nr:hypothetical protein F2P79_000937 [Pimephales promelas]
MLHVPATYIQQCHHLYRIIRDVSARGFRHSHTSVRRFHPDKEKQAADRDEGAGLTEKRWSQPPTATICCSRSRGSYNGVKPGALKTITGFPV